MLHPVDGRVRSTDPMVHGWIIPWECVHPHHRLPTFDPSSSTMRHITVLATIALISCPFVQANAQANAGPDQEVCGTSTTLQANPPIPGDSGFWSLISGNATFVDATDALTTVTTLAFGENVLLWNYTDAGGTTTTDQVSIWAFDPLAPAANAGPDQTIVGPPFTAQLAGSICTDPAFVPGPWWQEQV